MTFFTIRRVLGFTVISTVGAAGTAFSYKQSLIAARKATLNQEVNHLNSVLQHTRHEVDDEIAALERETQSVKEFSNTVVSVWDDRQERYRTGIKDSYSFLVALPESLGVLKGISNHFRYATEQLQRFSAFDITVSKVHNFSLLLSSVESIGLPKTCAALKELFTAEPLIYAVSSSVVALDRASEVDAPTSIAEANKTYTYVMESLESSIEEATARYHETMLQSQTPELSLVGQTLSNQLQALRTECNPQQVRAQKAAAELEAREKRLTRRLLSISDVAAAAAASTSALQQLRNVEHCAALEKYVLSDEKVKMNVKQLDLWRAAAERFVIEAQAASALRSYQTLLSHSLAQVHDVPEEQLQQ